MSDDPWASFPEVGAPAPAAGGNDPWAAFPEVQAVQSQPAPAPAPVPATPAGDESAAIGRGIVNGIPVVGPYLLGGLNRTAAAVRTLQNGTTFPEELQNVQRFSDQTAAQNPISTTAGEIGGAIVGTAPLVAAAPAAFGAGTAALPVRALTAAGTNATLGAADAVTRGQDPGSAALIGAGTGFVAPYAAAGIGKVVGGLAGRISPTVVPTIDELNASASAAYKAADDAGVQIAQPAFGKAVQGIGIAAQDAGIDKTLHPKAMAVLSRFEDAAGGSPTLQEIDRLRRVAKGATSSIEPDERRIGSLIVEKLDDFVGGLKPQDLVSGDASAVNSLTEARALWSRAKKSEAIADALESADLRAASTGSGGNADNAVRQNIRRLLESDASRGFNAEEKAAMETVVRGTPAQNALRLAGKLSPSGNGLMAALSIGATAMNPTMAVAPTVGVAAKALADRATTVNANRLAQLVQNGGAVAESPVAIAARARSEALARALLTPAPVVSNQRR